MKKSAFALIAFLALAGVTFGSISLSLDLIDSPAAGLNRYVLNATGTGITVLSQFQINIPVYQVYRTWVDDWDVTQYGQTEWINNGTMTENTSDSYVLFGKERIHGNEGVDPNIVTLETNAGPAGGSASGWGTLNNKTTTGGVSGDKTTWDCYYRTWDIDEPDLTTPETVPLMQLVLASDQVFSTDPTAPDITVNLGYVTEDFVPSTGKPNPIIETLTLPAQPEENPEVGDTDNNGFINLADLTNFGLGWFGPDGSGYVEGSGKTEEASWLHGDFDNNGFVNLADLTAFGTGWFGPNGSGYTGDAAFAAFASAVPEPGTIAMLILGALCLLGYRLRK